MRRGFVNIILIIVAVLIIAVFALPYPRYVGKTFCKPCADIGNCPPCRSEQWVWQKPLFWSVILPELKSTKQSSQQLQGGGAIESNVPIEQVDETANWKTYISNENKFSFKYPQNWNLRNLALNVIADETDSFVLERLFESVENSTPAPKYGIKVKAEKLRQRSFDEYISAVRISFQDKIETENKLSTNSILIEGLRYRNLDTPPFPAKVVIFNSREVFVEFELSSLQVNNKELREKETFDQILSTFKFL